MPVGKVAARHPANQGELAATTDLRGAVLEEPQPPPAVYQLNKMPQEPQRAGCANDSSAAHQQLQAASQVTPQQPDQANNGSSAHDRPCQLALPDVSAVMPVEPKCVAPSSGIATQDAALSLQPELTVHNPGRHDGFLCEVSNGRARTPAGLSPGPHMGMHHITEEQTASPKHVRQVTAQSLHPFTNKDAVSSPVAEESKGRDEMAHDGAEAPAAGVLQYLADSALTVAEVQSDISLGSAMFTTTSYKAASKKRRPFSWRKNGRSWRYVSPRRLCHRM